MSKAVIGKIVKGLAFAVFFAIMIANNFFRAFDFIPYGSLVVFLSFFVVWGVVYSILSMRGYFDWNNRK